MMRRPPRATTTPSPSRPAPPSSATPRITTATAVQMREQEPSGIGTSMLTPSAMPLTQHRPALSPQAMAPLTTTATTTTTPSIPALPSSATPRITTATAVQMREQEPSGIGTSMLTPSAMPLTQHRPALSPQAMSPMTTTATTTTTPSIPALPSSATPRITTATAVQMREQEPSGLGTSMLTPSAMLLTQHRPALSPQATSPIIPTATTTPTPSIPALPSSATPRITTATAVQMREQEPSGIGTSMLTPSAMPLTQHRPALSPQAMSPMTTTATTTTTPSIPALPSSATPRITTATAVQMREQEPSGIGTSMLTPSAMPLTQHRPALSPQAMSPMTTTATTTTTPSIPALPSSATPRITTATTR